MTAAVLNKHMSAATTTLVVLRSWILPVAVVGLIFIDLFQFSLDCAQVTMFAALAIAVVGIPHGTLDIEIASLRFGRSSTFEKLQILSGYIGCAAIMALCWILAPALALVLFLIISIIHFGHDWRGSCDPFLAMMVGWSIIALPALSHPQDVSAIFALLTGTQAGETIGALLACTSIAAAIGSLVFVYCTYRNSEFQTSVQVVSCLTAAILLPPLVAFAVFFCGLHSPRHMAEAMQECRSLSKLKKAFVIVALFSLSIALGVLLFGSGPNIHASAAVVRTSFMLISILTVPHFILEHLRVAKPH